MFNGAGWMQASVKGLSSYRLDEFHRGPVQNRPARTPAAQWRQAYATGPPCGRCRTSHCRGRGIREPPSSTGSSVTSGDAKSHGTSRVAGPSLELETQDDNITGGSLRPECECVSGARRDLIEANNHSAAAGLALRLFYLKDRPPPPAPCCTGTP